MNWNKPFFHIGLTAWHRRLKRPRFTQIGWWPASSAPAPPPPTKVSRHSRMFCCRPIILSYSGTDSRYLSHSRFKSISFKLFCVFGRKWMNIFRLTKVLVFRVIWNSATTTLTPSFLWVWFSWSVLWGTLRSSSLYCAARTGSPRQTSSCYICRLLICWLCSLFL